MTKPNSDAKDREPRLTNKDGTPTNYGLFGSLVNEIYANDNFVGSSLRYYYYIAISRKLFHDGIKNADNIFSRETMKAREWGRIPWDAITDDSRPVGGYVPRYHTKEDWVQMGIDYLSNVHKTYTLPRWHFQPVHVEVWLEKIALKLKFEDALEDLEVNIPIQKGYSSGGSLNQNQKRLNKISELYPDKQIVILYWGDWNPSGSDIERNVLTRLHKFGIHNIEFRRIAVTQEQIDEYNLPTAPAKTTDTRYKKWLNSHANGDDRTTDLDAFVALDHIDPRKPFRKLVRESIEPYFDNDIYQEQLKLQEKERKKVRRLVNKKVRFLEVEESE